MTEAYIPGTCNIGAAEIKRRHRNGYIGLAVAFLVLLMVEMFDLPKLYRLLIFPGLFYSISGFVQAKLRFCYLYGWLGVFSFSDRSHLQKVDRINLRKDRQKAIGILAIVFITSLVLTLVYYVV